MKLEELNEMAVPTDSKQRQAALKELLLKGEVPTVVSAGFSRGDFALGDLENLGYVKKYQDGAGRNIEEWHGITPKGKEAGIRFKMNGKLYGKGGAQETAKFEVDYS